ncbi:Autophagy-related protein, partial [Globisporangium splendens]
MDESLLGHDSHARHAADDDDELWNELKDDHRAAQAPLLHHDRDPHARHHHQVSGSAAPIPSLRAHVHLPAISNLFRNVADSAKRSVSRGGAAESSASSSSGSSWQPRISHAPDQYGRVANLDAFLISLYNYFYHKGFTSIAVVEIVALVTGLFSVTLSSFLMGCVQWKKIIECNHSKATGDKHCDADLAQFVTCRADDNSLATVLTSFYFVMFLGYWVFRALQLIGTLRDTHDMSTFYRERLHIDERQLQTVKWDEVVNRVLDLVGGGVHNSNNLPKNMIPKQISSYRLQIDPKLLATPHDFARRIMRRENYLIAFMNHSLFHGTNLLPPGMQFASTSHVMFSRNMECNINICLIDQMLDGDNNLSHAFIHDTKILQKRFLIAGVINFVLTPFILLYRVSHFFFVSAMEWHMNRVHYAGTRRWSSYALWKFREYNELPHVLDARMARSYPLAERYVAMFPGGMAAVIAGGVSFCASSLMAVFVGISLLDESLLLETTLYGRPLVWYLTLTTIAFAVSRTFTTTSSPFLINGDAEEAMMQVAAETHYFPKEWRAQCHTNDVHDAFLSLFPYKALLFAQECLSVVMAPYILCVSLPRCAREILLFVRSHSLLLPNVGAVCRFAEFDFKEYGNDMKMERSFVNFKQNHPQWVGAEEGERLMQQLGQLKEEEMEKSMRLGDTMYGSQMAMSMSQQLLQSQAIHTALGGRFGGGAFMAPQDNEFYWLEKVRD